MLYVIAARVAYEADQRKTPKVSKKEIMDQIGFTTASASVFISKMDDYIIRNFEPDNPDTYRDMDDRDINIKLNRKRVREAAKYVRGRISAPN